MTLTRRNFLVNMATLAVGTAAFPTVSFADNSHSYPKFPTSIPWVYRDLENARKCLVRNESFLYLREDINTYDLIQALAQQTNGANFRHSLAREWFGNRHFIRAFHEFVGDKAVEHLWNYFNGKKLTQPGTRRSTDDYQRQNIPFTKWDQKYGYRPGVGFALPMELIYPLNGRTSNRRIRKQRYAYKLRMSATFLEDATNHEGKSIEGYVIPESSYVYPVHSLGFGTERPDKIERRSLVLTIYVDVYNMYDGVPEDDRLNFHSLVFYYVMQSPADLKDHSLNESIERALEYGGLMKYNLLLKDPQNTKG